MRMTKLSQCIGKGFYGLHRDIREGGHTHYWLKGGRGSGKSSFLSIEIILGLVEDEDANAVVLRKVAANLRDSVFEQMTWASHALGVEDEWERKVSPMELVRKNTGQKVLFRGCDDPRKLKSIKFQRGYAKFIWYEEVDEFGGMQELRNLNQSLMRGGEEFRIFYSYNPPKHARSWVNQEMAEEREDRLVHHSTYKEMPQEWLGSQFLAEAEYIRKRHPETYRHEYMGEVTGSGGEVFRNLTLREISDEEIAAFDRISRGLDWGYAVDPLHYTVNHYDKTRRRLYIFFELRAQGMSNRRLAEEIGKENPNHREVICDSAEPKSIAEMRDYGVAAVGAKKGPDSVYYGIKWLQDLEEIIIDPKRCPETAKEFYGYEYEGDGKGGWKAAFPDRENHAIDAVRYSREDDMRHIRIR
ncbi:MAG: PBSX family phage terminase large subunit [Bacteroidales bacterium]|nr:PBSX family phage terminase large subunit [Bacteroidales bacterium]